MVSVLSYILSISYSGTDSWSQGHLQCQQPQIVPLAVLAKMTSQPAYSFTVMTIHLIPMFFFKRSCNSC